MDMNLLLIASNNPPATVLLPAYDLAVALRDRHQPVIGGFQTPLEQECLGILPQGTAPIAIYPARLFDPARHSLYGRSLGASVRRGVADGRVTIVEPPGMVGKRPIIPNARKRNLHLLGLCDAVLLLYATPGGDAEGLVRVALGRGLAVAVLDHPANVHWLDLGATVWGLGDAVS